MKSAGPIALTVLLLAVAAGHAQAPPAPPQNPPAAAQAVPLPPPAPGFVPIFEIVRTLRAAGFDPLEPPLREGTIYVARATDYRGILMRVVLDARTGAIRDANRIVPGPGNYGGPYGPGPYGPPPYGPPPYGPAPYGQVGIVPAPYDSPDDAPPPVERSATRPAVPPLPRPRPPQLASRRPAETAKPALATDPNPAAKPDVTFCGTGAAHRAAGEAGQTAVGVDDRQLTGLRVVAIVGAALVADLWWACRHTTGAHEGRPYGARRENNGLLYACRVGAALVAARRRRLQIKAPRKTGALRQRFIERIAYAAFWFSIGLPLVLPAIGIERGFFASGISRTRSTCRRPFSRLAPLTWTKSASWNTRSKVRAAMPW